MLAMTECLTFFYQEPTHQDKDCSAFLLLLLVHTIQIQIWYTLKPLSNTFWNRTC